MYPITEIEIHEAKLQQIKEVDNSTMRVGWLYLSQTYSHQTKIWKPEATFRGKKRKREKRKEKERTKERKEREREKLERI